VPPTAEVWRILSVVRTRLVRWTTLKIGIALVLEFGEALER